jgi:phenylacetic acid degradation operon negative regulatory protein
VGAPSFALGQLRQQLQRPDTRSITKRPRRVCDYFAEPLPPITVKRRLRRILRKRLLWLGFGTLNNATWISPQNLRAEVEQVVSALNVCSYVEFFTAEHRGFASDEEIVTRCWNLEQLNDYYATFIARYDPLFQEHQARLRAGDSLEPQECFMQCFMLIHEYRSSPYVDPNLPLELLPDDWLGEKATQIFRQYYNLLIEKAEAFVDSVLAKAP